MRKSLFTLWVLLSPLVTLGFLPLCHTSRHALSNQYSRSERKAAEKRKILSSKRRQQLGIPDNEDEYDLDKALETNTDPLISKIVAGSLIVVILALLVVGVIVPSLTDYGEGVCSPIQNGGRC